MKTISTLAVLAGLLLVFAVPAAAQPVNEQAQDRFDTLAANQTDDFDAGDAQGLAQTVITLLQDIQLQLTEMNDRLERLEEAHNVSEDVTANDTLNETGNETVTDASTVTITDQTASDSTITVDSATLPDGGYIAIHDSSLQTANTTEEVVDSVIAVSGYLGPGTYEDETINVSADNPFADINGTELNETQTLIAMPHQETGNNTVYDFVATGGEEDGPYFVNNDPDQGPVIDAATITVSGQTNTTETL